jgi:valyl-tRNA synthetase
MPFITEEVWHRIPGTSGSIMKEIFPESADYPADAAALKDMANVMGVINGIRNIRGEMNIHPSKKVDIHIEMPEDSLRETLLPNLSYVKNLARVENVKIEKELPKPEASATAVFEGNQIHILLKGIIDFDEEKGRINKDIAKVRKEIADSEKKLSNKGFLEKAPDDVIEKVKEKVSTLQARLNKLEENLSFFEEIDD